ncbi:MAG: hypothetical protein WCO56_12950 [Verrucomicrobiota bacterium]
MNKSLILIKTALYILMGIFWLGVVQAESPQTFAQRQKLFLDSVWQDYQAHVDKPSAKSAFWRAEALFELGKVEEGRRLVGRGLDQMVPGNRENRWIHGGNSGFVAWPGVDCYIRYERFLDEPLKERNRKIYTGAVFYKRLSTSNHKIMAAVTRYLATQIWGLNAFHADPFFKGQEEDGTRFEKNDPTGEKYIRSLIQETVKSGPGEFASRPYGAENILPLLTLAECAQDSGIRQSAALAYEYSLIELAPAWLRGHLATFAPRSYPDMETQQPWGIAVVPWAYFGGIPPGELHDQWALRTATASYRMPDALLASGADRSQPYVYRALINRWALYHYVNQDYALFSRSPKASTRQFMGQSYPCGVMWEEPNVNHGSHLWITNPSADDNHAEGNKTTGIHTHGVTQYEQELQYRDALLFVFNIAPNFRNPYALAYIPGGYRAALTAPNRLFLHYGTVLVAVSASHPFTFNPQSGIRAPAGKAREGDSEFRIPTLQTAVALETALPADFPGADPEKQLAAFRDLLLAKARIELQSGVKPVGRYTDRHGNTLECVYDGEDKINGKTVDYTRWPTLESPWLQQPSPESSLVLTDGKRTRTYDFQNWKVVESAGKPRD